MLRPIFIALSLLLAGCETTPVKTATEIETEQHVDESIGLPINTPVAIYVDNYNPDKGLNFYGSMKEAAELVTKDFFSDVEYLKSGKPFQYLVKFRTNSNWLPAWGRWETTVKMEILNDSGNTIYTRDLKNASGMTTLTDFSAIFNSQAKMTKESLIDFLNSKGSSQLQTATNSYDNTSSPPPIKQLLKDLKPSSTGTGFYIDENGTVMTANHVVQDCILVEIGSNQKTFEADIREKSRILDIAVLSTGNQDTPSVFMTDKSSAAILGKSIFVTGYPLQGLLSDSPSLTIGTVTSLGGLKGSTGSFMFSAPVQPGNSGSAIVDYSGNLVGMATSSLNQKMLLEKLDASSQNVNFGIDLSMLKKFLDKNQISYNNSRSVDNFESASVRAVEYTNQVLCYK